MRTSERLQGIVGTKIREVEFRESHGREAVTIKLSDGQCFEAWSAEDYGMDWVVHPAPRKLTA